MSKYLIKTDDDRLSVIAKIDSMISSGAVPEIDVRVYDPTRTVDQNSLLYKIYKAVSVEKGDESATEIKLYCKLKIGSPILGARDSKFRRIFNMAIKPLRYELQLEAIDLLPVSSRMTKKELSEYIESIKRFYAEAGIYVNI